jgi:glutaredoxin
MAHKRSQAVAKVAVSKSRAPVGTTSTVVHAKLAGRPDKGHVAYEVPQPSTTRDYTIYSLPTCGYSVAATKLIQSYQPTKLDVQVYPIKPMLKSISNEHRVNLTEAKKILFQSLNPSVGDHFTYPIIFVNVGTESGEKEIKFLGGYNEFCKYLGVVPQKFNY